MRYLIRFICSEAIFSAARRQLERTGSDGELHWQHTEQQSCNNSCTFILNGKNVTHTSQPPLAPWDYEPGEYARHVMHIAARHAGSAIADRNEQIRLQAAFHMSPHQSFTNREETAMQATYNVEKLIKALEEKKTSIEEVNNNEAEFIKNKFTERVDEALADGNTPNYGRILHEVEVEAGNMFNAVDRTGVLLIDKSIFKLKMVDAESVTLDDQEFRSLGLN